MFPYGKKEALPKGRSPLGLGEDHCSHGYGPAARRHWSLMVREGRPGELEAVAMCPVAKMPGSLPQERAGFQDNLRRGEGRMWLLVCILAPQTERA